MIYNVLDKVVVLGPERTKLKLNFCSNITH